MNYRHVYMLIINHAKSEMKNGLRPINRSQYSKHWRNKGFYFEFHHILPKSLFPNWSKKHSNLVCLTAREHYFCHELLVKIYPSNQMFFAIFAFINRPNTDLKNYKITMRQYEKLKKIESEIKSISQKGRITYNNLSEEQKSAIKKSASIRFKTFWENLPEGERDRLNTIRIESLKQSWAIHYNERVDKFHKYMLTEEYKISREKYKNTMNSKSKEEIKEINNKKGKAALGKKWFNNGEIQVLSYECPEGFTPGRLSLSEEKLQHYRDVRNKNNVGSKISKSLLSRTEEEKKESIKKRQETLKNKSELQKLEELKSRKETISKRTKEENIRIRQKQLETMRKNGYIFKKDIKDE